MAAIAKSDQIREHLRDKGFNPPKSQETVMKHISEYYQEIAEDKREVIKKLKAEGQRFSVDLDEYTSIQNRRFMNVNLFFNNGYINLGLVRMKGSHKAGDCLELLEKKLESFGVSLSKDVVSETADGASVMQKLGVLSPAEHQACFAHALHLAVMGTIYNKKDENNNDEDNRQVEDADDCDEEADDSDEDAEDCDEDANDSGELLDEDELDPELGSACQPPELVPELKSVVDKVRKIARMFRRSPVKNDTLRTYTKVEFGHELGLLLDSKTRWNSLVLMLERYLKLRRAVTKSLIDFGETQEYVMSESELELISNIVNALEPLKAAAEMICRREANLLTADDTFKYLLLEIGSQESPLSRDLTKAPIARIGERRKSILVGLLKFLDTPGCLTERNDLATFKMPKKSDMISLAARLHKRLFDISQEEEGAGSLQDVIEPEINQEASLTFAQRLEQFVKEKKETSAQKETNLLKKDFTFFEATGERPVKLEKLYKALLTVRPSSVESERVFSTTGFFLTKFRTSLTDNHLSILVFLRNHFLLPK